MAQLAILVGTTLAALGLTVRLQGHDASGYFSKLAALVDLWAIHDWLGSQRKAVDEKYDFRHSQLIFVFARLLREGMIGKQDLARLTEEKRRLIRTLAFGFA